MPQIAVAAATSVVVSIHSTLTAAGMAVGLTKTAAYAASSFLVKTAMSAALSAAIGMLTQPSVGRTGNPVEWSADPNAPLPFLIGEMRVGGHIIARQEFGSENMYQGIVGLVSAAGPIHAIDAVLVENTAVNFDANHEAIGTYHDKLWVKYQLGQQPEPSYLSTPSGLRHGAVWPGWTSEHKLSGKAAYMAIFGHDSKAKVWRRGDLPEFALLARGLHAWDPRLDDTYPGGSGPQRRDDPSTWGYTRNPGLHALKQARGYWEGANGGVPHVDTLVGGMGLKDDEIDIASYVEVANVADALGLTVNGVPTTDDDKWQVQKAILQAGGAFPVSDNGKLTAIVRVAQKASLMTLDLDDIVGRIEFARTPSEIERINTIFPRFRSPSHKWEMVVADPIQRDEYLAMDQGRRRSREVNYPYVTSLAQVGLLAAYDIADSREGFNGGMLVKPHLKELKIGDCFTMPTSDFLGPLSGVKLRLMSRRFNPETMQLALGFRQETDEKHVWAGGIVETVPPPIDPTSPPDPPAPPDPTDWEVDPVPPVPDGPTRPIVRVTGGTTNPVADTVLFYTGPTAEGPWLLSKSLPATATETDLQDGLVPGEDVYVAVANSSVVSGEGSKTVLGPVTVPDLIASDTRAVNGRPSLDITQALDAHQEALDDFWDRLDGIDGVGGALDGLQSAINSLNETVGDPVTGLAKAHADIATLDSTKAEKTVVDALTSRTVVVEGQSVPPGLLTGASGDLVLTPNMTGSGPNAGEIRVEGSFLNHPTLGRTAITAGELLSQFEGSGPVPPGGRFYVIWSGQALADRFDPPLTGTLGRLFTAAYDWESGVWVAYGNTGDGQTFAPAENDLLVAVCGRTSSGGGSGIDWLRPAFSQLAAIDARIGGLETVVTTPTTGLASRLEVLEAEINTPETGLAAVVAEHAAVIADLDENYASASRVTDIEAEIAAARDGQDSLNARILDVAETAASDTQAVAETLTVLQARTVAPGVNLIANPSGQRGLDGWTATGGDWSAVATGGFRLGPGSGAVRLNSGFFAVSAGQKVSAQVEMLVAGISAGDYRACLEFFDDSAQIGASIDVGVQSTSTVGAWVRHVLDGQTAPTGTTRARFALVRSSLTNAGAIGRWRRVKAEIGDRATTYSEDGLGLSFGATIGAHQTAIVDLETGKASATDFNLVKAEVETARNGQASLNAELTAMRQATADEASARAMAISQVRAEATTNPNLLRNSTAADGLSGWPLGAGWARFADADGTGFVNVGNGANRLGYSDYYDLSDLGLAPGDWMSVSAEFALTGRTTGSAQVRLDFWDASTQLVTNIMARRETSGDFPGRAGSAVQIPVGATRFRVRVQCASLNTGATARIRRIKVEKGQQQTAWTDDRLSRDLASAVTDATEALVDLENNYSLARWVKKAEASGGRPALLGLESTSEGPSGVILAADQIWLGDNTYFDDISNTFITDAAGQRTIQMGPFGAAGDLIFWQGADSVAPGSATTANGARAITRDGKAYVNGYIQQEVYREDATNVPSTTISTSWIDVLTMTIGAGPGNDDTFHIQVGLGIQTSPSRTRSSTGSQAPAGEWQVVEQNAAGTEKRVVAEGRWSTTIIGAGANAAYVSNMSIDLGSTPGVAERSDISREWPFKYGAGGKLVMRMKADPGANLITPVVKLWSFVTRYT